MPTFHLLLLATALCGRASASGAPTAQAPARGIVADPAQTGWAGMQLWRAVRGMVAGAWERGNCARNRRHIADGAPCVRPTPVEDDPDAPNQEAAAHPTGPPGSFAGFQSFDHPLHDVAVDPLHNDADLDRLRALMDEEEEGGASDEAKDADKLADGEASEASDAGAGAAGAPERQHQADVHAGQQLEPQRQEQADSGETLDAAAIFDDTRADAHAMVPDRPEEDPADSGEEVNDAAIFAAFFAAFRGPEKSPDAEPSGDEETPIIPIAGGPERVPSPAPDSGEEQGDDDAIPEADDDDADSERSWGAPEEAETPTPPRPKPKSSSTAIMTASALLVAAVAVAL